MPGRGRRYKSPSLRIPALRTSDQPFPAYSWDQNMNVNNNKTTTTMTTTTATTTDMSYRNPITESEEDELLASSQETSKSTTGRTNQSTPVDTADKISNLPTTSKAAMSTNQSALTAKGDSKKKRKTSQNQLRKNRYQRAVFILGKIAKDQAAGTPVDEAETKRLKSIVEEYESYLKRKQSQPQEQSKKESTSQKRNRSTTEVPGAQPKKPRRSEGEHSSTTTARYFCDVARDSLQVAIIDGKSSSPSTIQERWVEIDVRLSSMVLSYVLDNPAGPHPEFDSSETLRGYRVIKRDLRCIKLQNKSIPGIDEWQLIKEEKPNKASKPILVTICEESIEALKKTDNKVSFGIRKARLKIFQGDKAADEDDTEEVDVASQLLRNAGIEEPRDAQ
ncbi:uncharacterized protein LOC125779342 [Bactrocera dorsalis]|uniref:Uncharacterized protein LOC125779342 n=1 Tax=Bactrocera dorsalis TaxID=27457 RepID=A0ABM3K532_BACDO|nr:uncharacterized protein LOC125779342 [Bactrocera dorsalis]XP_049316594.1 uncharacterized protein LOC125779342 [Bactrocera dorsalis]